MMVCAADTIACRPLPHRRFSVRHGVSLATPPFTAATRPRYMSLGSVLSTCPNTTWPTSEPCTAARFIASATTVAPSWVGGTSFRLPPKVPMAVRTPLTTTTSRMVFSRILSSETNGERRPPDGRFDWLGILARGAGAPIDLR